MLGAGGVGTFLGAALARAGRDVLLVMREQSLAGYGGVVEVESALLGSFEATVPAAPVLDRPVDALWVTTKATQLADALERAPAEAARGAIVVPLLNGLEHVDVPSPDLRRRRRAPGVDDGRVGARGAGGGATAEQLRVGPALPGSGAEELRSELVEAGLTASIGESEADVLWRKVALLAPIALTTTLRRSTLDGVIADEAWRTRIHRSVREITAIARAEGVALDADALIAAIEGVPPGMRSSMQKDREAGRPTEIDAIGGAVLRAAARHGLGAPTTRDLVDAISAGEPMTA